MKIKQVSLVGFKRFHNLSITGLSESVKLVVLVGSNGSGKSSVFEGFNHWYKWHGYRHFGEQDFYLKKGSASDAGSWYDNSVSVVFWNTTPTQQQAHKAFYFRTAYRNEADFTTDSLKQMGDPSERNRFDKLIVTDASVSENYRRLASLTLKGVYSGEHDGKSVKELRELLVGQIQRSLSHVFEDLQLDGVGDPLVNGSFYFSKGTSKGFHYKNLSAGEKSAFDLILDLVVQKQYYPEAVYCIDEPETHMHTSLQSNLLKELNELIPAQGQMWLSTHSIGMLKAAREIEEQHPGTVAFFDFSNYDFDSPVEMCPAVIDSTIWSRFLDLAFGDLSGLVAPQTIVFCEGNPTASNNKNFDAQIYQRIFGSTNPSLCFVSLGSCSEVEDENNVSVQIIKSILKKSTIIRLIDRDNRSDEEVQDAVKAGLRVLSRRHLESYLLDDEVLRKLCVHFGKPDAVDDVLRIKRRAIAASTERGNEDTDIKSAAGEMVVGIKRQLGLRNCGNTTVTFLRDTIAPLITPDMGVYKQLNSEIFGA